MKNTDLLKKQILTSLKGGPGSGHFGHRGRPGEQGGSLPAEGGKLNYDEDWANDDNYDEDDCLKEGFIDENGNKVVGKSYMADEMTASEIVLVTNAKHIGINYPTFLVAIKGNSVYGMRGVGIHEAMAGDVYQIEHKREDEYVHFRGNPSTGQLSVSIHFAGVVIRTNEDKERALENIYKALDKLYKLGADALTQVAISNYLPERKIFNITIKERKIKDAIIRNLKGGHGSGHFGHRGRPGEQGGSLPAESGKANIEPGDTILSGKGNRLIGPYFEASVYDIKDASVIPGNILTFLVEIKGNEVLGCDKKVLHSEMIKTAYPDYSKNVDDYVHFRYLPYEKLVSANIWFAGVNDINSEREARRALDNVYKALDKLFKLGLAGSTRVIIAQPGVGPAIDTTIKEKTEKGGPGSGHFGHSGRPGEQGGSLPSKAGKHNLRQDEPQKGEKDEKGNEVVANIERAFMLSGDKTAVWRINNAEDISKRFDTIIVSIGKGGVYGTTFITAHDYIADAVRDFEDSKTTDDYVHFRGTDEGALRVSLNYAGVYDLTKPGNRERAINNVYKAFEKLFKLGAPAKTRVLIVSYTENGDWLDTTIKSRREKGGPGSGHYGHAGRPGLQGGSLPAGSGKSDIKHVIRPDDIYTSSLQIKDTPDRIYQGGHLQNSYVISPDGKVVYADMRPDEKTYDWIKSQQTHTLLYSRLALSKDAPSGITEEDKQQARENLFNGVLEDEEIEYLFFEKGYISYGENFGDFYVKMKGPITKSSVNKLLRLYDAGKIRLKDITKPISIEGFEYKTNPYTGESFLENQHIKLTIGELDQIKGFTYGTKRWQGRDFPYLMPVFKDKKLKGGPGSGFYGHSGRPGEQGGSLPRGFGKLNYDSDIDDDIRDGLYSLFGSSHQPKKSPDLPPRTPFLSDPDRDYVPPYVISPDNFTFSSALAGSFPATHTQIFAGLAFSSDNKWEVTPDELERAANVVRFNTLEDEDMEYVFLSKGFISIRRSGVFDSYTVKFWGKLDADIVKRVYKLWEKGLIPTAESYRFADMQSGQQAVVRLIELQSVAGFRKIGSEFDLFPILKEHKIKDAILHAFKGGVGSGHFGHAGRPGLEGGSLPKSEKRKALELYLRSIDKMTEGRSAEGIVNKYGKYYKPQKLPENIVREAHRECYANAWRLSEETGMQYVEGFAMPDFIDLPIHHAWCVDKKGNVYDNTWDTPGVVYFGVPFDPEFVNRVLLEKGTFGIIDFTSKLFRETYAKFLKLKGGPGSGHFGHAGRPGEVGGSLPTGEGKSNLMTTSIKLDLLSRLESNIKSIFGGNLIEIKKAPNENCSFVVTPDDKALRAKRVGSEYRATHTLIYAKHALETNASFIDKDWAEDIIREEYYEAPEFETEFFKKGYISISSAEWYGGKILTIKSNSADRALLRRVVKLRDSGFFDNFGADTKVYFEFIFDGDAYADTESIPLGLLDTISGFKNNPLNDFKIDFIEKEKKFKGGPGSGHFGHSGRPGEQGGSLPSGAGKSNYVLGEATPFGKVVGKMGRLNPLDVFEFTDTSVLLDKESTFLVALRGNEVIGCFDYQLHSSVIRAVHGDSKTVDDYVHFRVFGKTIDASEYYAGVVVSRGKGDEQALDNIYKALEKLYKLGMPGNTSVEIRRAYHKNLSTTVKEKKLKGGPGSGHFGHRGRPGEQGGSLPAESGKHNYEIPKKFGITHLDQFGDDITYEFYHYDTFDEMMKDEDTRFNSVSYFILKDGTLLRTPSFAEHADAIMALLESPKYRFIAADGDYDAILKYIEEKSTKFGVMPDAIPDEVSKNLIRVRHSYGIVGISTQAVNDKWLKRLQDVLASAIPMGSLDRPMQVVWSPYVGFANSKKWLRTNTYELLQAEGVRRINEEFSLKENILSKLKGGPGSGHFGHRGRPGEQGGSLPSEGAKLEYSTVNETKYDMFKKAPELIKKEVNFLVVDDYGFASEVDYYEANETLTNRIASLSNIDEGTIEANAPKKYWITPNGEIYTDDGDQDQSHTKILAKWIAFDRENSERYGFDLERAQEILLEMRYEDSYFEKKAIELGFTKVEMLELDGVQEGVVVEVSNFTPDTFRRLKKLFEKNKIKNMIEGKYADVFVMSERNQVRTNALGILSSEDWAELFSATKQLKQKVLHRLKGGPGSGHFGHRGRPGEQGGSLPSEVGKLEYTHDIKKDGQRDDLFSLSYAKKVDAVFSEIEKNNIPQKARVWAEKDFTKPGEYLISRNGVVVDVSGPGHDNFATNIMGWRTGIETQAIIDRENDPEGYRSNYGNPLMQPADVLLEYAGVIRMTGDRYGYAIQASRLHISRAQKEILESIIRLNPKYCELQFSEDNVYGSLRNGPHPHTLEKETIYRGAEEILRALGIDY